MVTPENQSTIPSIASGEMHPDLYTELQRLARRHMADERGPQTLTATALVHEAWLRVDGGSGRIWENQRHFFGAAAEAMRRILIDRARRKLAGKRGGGELDARIEDVEVMAPSPDEELLAVHEVLDQFATVDASAAEIVRLHYFAGLTWVQISGLTGISERDLQRLWQFARTWLHAAITSGGA